MCFYNLVVGVVVLDDAPLGEVYQRRCGTHEADGLFRLLVLAFGTRGAEGHGVIIHCSTGICHISGGTQLDWIKFCMVHAIITVTVVVSMLVY